MFDSGCQREREGDHSGSSTVWMFSSTKDFKVLNLHQTSESIMPRQCEGVSDQYASWSLLISSKLDQQTPGSSLLIPDLHGQESARSRRVAVLEAYRDAQVYIQ